MAEKVQSILERMVPPLKDLRDRGIFAPEEIRSIVERRRKSEYLLHRPNGAQRGDYLRYIEEEVLLERLRKLRKERVMREMKERRREERRRDKRGDDGDEQEGSGISRGGAGRKHASQTSGPGDSHIVSHVHFLYQRALRKFGYPIDILLNYAEFAKEQKSFKALGRLYAEGLQRHPREAGLWIEAASFEYFGYVAQDYDHGDEISSKVVGSSIRNARVLMQRGLRINGKSEELWLQYFVLELHYVQKLWGRREILEEGREADDFGDDDGEKSSQEDDSKILTVAKTVLEHAIISIPDDVKFRLKFVEACRRFPRTEVLEELVMEGIKRDFNESVEGWVARISYAEGLRTKVSTARRNRAGMDGGIKKEKSDDGVSKDDDEGEKRPPKKARTQSKERVGDPALKLLQEALAAVPKPRMYLECARFLRLRIGQLLDEGCNNKAGKDEDVMHLLGEGEDVEVAALRHGHLLEELYKDARERDATSTSLTLDNVNYLLCAGKAQEAEGLLSDAVSSSNVIVEPRLWLRWAEVANGIKAEGGTPLRSSARILRQALERTPLREGCACRAIMVKLMGQLMEMPSSNGDTANELRSLFQRLLLLSRSSSVLSMRKSANEDDEGDEEEDEIEESDIASTLLAYLKHVILYDDADAAAVRSVYVNVLYSSNYGRSCSGKTEGEILAMKTFFDTCFEFETQVQQHDKAKGKDERKKRKKARITRLCKLHEAAIAFFETGGMEWRKIAEGYRRGLQDVRCGSYGCR